MQSFTVTGMSCSHCVRAVTAAVKARDGNATVRVDLDRGRVEVESTAPRADLAAAIAQEGYEVVG